MTHGTDTFSTTLVLTYEQPEAPVEKKSTNETNITYPSNTANRSPQVDTTQKFMKRNLEKEGSSSNKQPKFLAKKLKTKLNNFLNRFSKKTTKQ